MIWNEDRLLPYQWRMVEHIEDHPDAMLWADMGLGKTICALTAITRLQANLDATAVLVVAPLRIIQSVWRQEAEKWEHTRHLRFSLIHGTKEKRITALWRKADVYLVNYENLVWLATEIQHRYLSKGKRPPFDMVIYDEVTKVKNVTTNRGKAWAKLLPYFSRRVGLTGEPASNGYKDLHGQFFFVDRGRRLGAGVQQFRERFLRPAGYGGFDWIATVTGREQIHRRISDITLELAAKDYIDLPELKTNTIWVDLPRDARRIYDELEKEFFAELASGAELEVMNEASKINKLLQIASGAAYYSDGAWEEVHKAKVEALQDAVEEAGGRPMLLGYTYRHEAARIAQALPEKPLSHSGATFLSSKLGEKAVADIIRRWEFDEIPLLCGHPASMGHGLNLQGSSARAAIWFSLPWSLELYNQLNGRLFGGHRRQGASVVHHILARDTVDEVVYETLQSKSGTQAGLRAAIKQYWEKRR
jgi:SNF2 family DNA or RNA helicase